jgi:hypothetical protein
MMSVTRTLLQQIDKEAEETRNSSGYGTVDIWTLMQCLTLDVLGEAAFGESFRMVEDGNHVVPKSIMKRMRFSAFVMAYPTLANLIVTGKQPQEMMDVSLGHKERIQFLIIYG